MTITPGRCGGCDETSKPVALFRVRFGAVRSLVAYCAECEECARGLWQGAPCCGEPADEIEPATEPDTAEAWGAAQDCAAAARRAEQAGNSPLAALMWDAAAEYGAHCAEPVRCWRCGGPLDDSFEPATCVNACHTWPADILDGEG
jgi:hypothetical protein